MARATTAMTVTFNLHNQKPEDIDWEEVVEAAARRIDSSVIANNVGGIHDNTIVTVRKGEHGKML